MADCVGNWQKVLDDQLDTLLQSGGLDLFKAAQTDEDRVKFVLQKEIILSVPWISAYFDKCEQLHQKSEKRSQTLRSKGNKCFQQMKFSEALEQYTKSILFAPLKSKEMALAYANRSAALFHLCRYQECLSSINEALVHQYPEELRYKLHLRKGQCLFKLGKLAEARAELGKTRLCLETHLFLDKKKYDSIISDVEQLEIKTEEKKNLVQQVTEEVKGNSGRPVVSYGSNPVVSQAASALELHCNKEKGRHFVAAQKISPGDTLIVEQPFAAVLLPSSYDLHCHHCFGKMCELIPCSQCSLAWFCSQSCHDVAWAVYHRVECRYLDLLHSTQDDRSLYTRLDAETLRNKDIYTIEKSKWSEDFITSSGVGIAHLALRIVLKAGLQFLLDFGVMRRKAVGVAGLDEKGRYGRTYETVYHLLRHTEDMDSQDLFQYSMTAALLVHMLQHSKWFGCREAETGTSKDGSVTGQNPSTLNNNDHKSAGSGFLSHTATKGEIYIGGLILRHIQQLICNAHAITEVQSSLSSSSDLSLVGGKSQVRVAAAVYPTTSLLNHSCDPSIILSYQKDVVVVRAIKDVAKGEEVYSCYAIQSEGLIDMLTVIKGIEHSDRDGFYYNSQISEKKTSWGFQRSEPQYWMAGSGTDVAYINSTTDLWQHHNMGCCPHYKRMSYTKRQQALQEQYFFGCTCEVCLQKGEAEAVFQALSCPQCKDALEIKGLLKKCKSCGTETDGLMEEQTLREAEQFFTEGWHLLEESDTRGALKMFERCHELRQSVLYQHHTDLGEVLDCMARCHAIQGSFKAAADCLQKSLHITELQYGENSIEVAHELQKLAEVLISGGWNYQARPIIRKARALFSLHYGEDCPHIKELDSI